MIIIINNLKFGGEKNMTSALSNPARVDSVKTNTTKSIFTTINFG